MKKSSLFVFVALIVMMANLAFNVKAATPVVPTLQILYPNGGQVLHHNEEVFVTWNTFNFDWYGNIVVLLESQSPLGADYTIVRPCYPDVGATGCNSIPNYGGNNGFLDYYRFRVPSSVTPGNYKLVLGVVDFDTGEAIAVDRSDTAFEVSSEPSVLAVVSPATNVTWGAGTMQSASIFRRGFEGQGVSLQIVRVEDGTTYEYGEWLTSTNFSEGGKDVITPRFAVPITVQPGTYALKAQSYDQVVQQSVGAYSEGIITVTSALTSPKANQTLFAGKAYALRWNTAGISKYAYATVSVTGWNVNNPDQVAYLGTVRMAKGRLMVRLPKDMLTGNSKFVFHAVTYHAGFTSPSFSVVNKKKPTTPPIGVGVKG